MVETRVPENVTSTCNPFFVSLPMTTIDGTAWNYDVAVYPKNQTGNPTLDKTVREATNSTGKNTGSLTDIKDGYEHTASASIGDTVDYQIISTLPTITSKASALSEYTYVDTMSKGIKYNKNDVVIEFFRDAGCTDKITTWAEDSGKFTVAYDDAQNIMTIRMTDTGLAEINEAATVYTDSMKRGYSDCTILITAAVRLSAFIIPQIRDITSRDEMELSMMGERKQAVFAVIPDSDSTFNYLVGMLYTCAFQSLYYQADKVHQGPLPVPMRLMMDEFCNVALPSDFVKIQSTMRSRNIMSTIVLQNISGLKALFKDDWEGLLGNADTLLYLGGNEQSTHKYISELLGKETLDVRHTSTTKGRNGSTSVSRQQLARDLMTPDEVRAMDNRYALLFIRGERPVMDEKYDILRHPNLSRTEDGGAAPYVHKLADYACADMSAAFVSLEELILLEGFTE